MSQRLRRSLGVISLSVFAAACGAKSALWAPDLPDAQRDAGTLVDTVPDVVRDDVVREDVAIDTPPSGPCTWEVGPPNVIVEGPASSNLIAETVFPFQDGALVGWSEPPSGSNVLRRFIARTDVDARRVVDRTLAFTEGLNTMNVGFLVGVSRVPNEAGLLSWTLDRGCRFVRVDPMLRAIGSVRDIYSSTCGSLQASTDGFTILHEDPESLDSVNTLTRLDANGAVLPRDAEVQLVDPSENPFSTGRVVLAPGRFLFTWRRRNSSPAYMAMSFDETGRPLATAPTQLTPAFENTGVGRGFGGAFAWWTFGGALLAIPFTPEGVARPQIRFPFVDPNNIQTFSTTIFGGRTASLYAFARNGASVLTLREPALDGTHGPVIDVETSPDGRYTRAQIAETSQGAVLVYTVREPNLIRILARKITCPTR